MRAAVARRMALKVSPPGAGPGSGPGIDFGAVLPGPALTGKSFSGTLSHSCKTSAVALPEADAFKTYP